LKNNSLAKDLLTDEIMGELEELIKETIGR
jgi:hypothetical protein